MTKKRWWRIAALVLVLCLFVNNCINNSLFALYVHAEGTASDSTEVISVSSGDSLPTISQEPTATPALTATPTVQPTTMPTATPTAIPTATPTESSTDKVQANVVVKNTFSLQSSTFSVKATENVSFPLTITDYNTAYANGTRAFSISSYDQLLAVQELCEAASGYQGVTLEFGSPTNTGSDKEKFTWYIDEVEGFEGIGTQDMPFKGSMTCAGGTTAGISFQLDTPLFMYLGDGANVESMYLISNGASAMVADSVSGNAMIEGMVLAGSVSDSEKTAGLVVGTITSGNPQINNLTLNGDITVNGTTAGGIIGSVEAEAGVTVNTVTGNAITVTGTTAGGIAGAVGANATVALSNVVTGTVIVSGGTVGGLAGTLASGATVSDAVSFSSTTVKGTAAAGGHFGSVTGACRWDLASEANLNASIIGENSDCRSGQFAGIMEEDASLNIKNGTTVEVRVSGTGDGGGVVGLCRKRASIALEEGTLTISGSVKMGGYSGGLIGVAFSGDRDFSGYTISAEVTGDTAGGLIGIISDKQNCVYEISDVTVSGNVEGTTVGGIVGKIDTAKVELQEIAISSALTGATVGGLVGNIAGGSYLFADVEMGGAVNGSGATGGLVGNVDSAAVELQGIKITPSTFTGSPRGILVGSQTNSLIYFAKAGEVSTIGTDADSLTNSMSGIDEIGEYGGVYRNHYISGDNKLIGDGSLENVGVIDVAKVGYQVAHNGTAFQMTSEIDFELLAIALRTDGKYGMENKNGDAIFQNTTAGDYTTLLKSSAYELTANVDISYTKTGIVTLNKNDTASIADKTNAFIGSIVGKNNTKYTITHHVDTRQHYVGLFSTIAGGKDTTFFKYLTLDGEISNARGAGGLAYMSCDNCGLTLENFDLKRTITSTGGGFGGLIYQASKFTLAAKDVTLAANVTIGWESGGASRRSSGFITQIDSRGSVSMENVVLGGSYTCTGDGNTTGGLLGRVWTNVSGTIKNVSIHEDGATLASEGSFGALVTELSTPSGSRFTFENVDFKGLKVTNTKERSNCALLVRKATDAIVEVINYSTEDCIVITPGDYFDEIVGYNKSSTSALDTCGIVSVHYCPDDDADENGCQCTTGSFPTCYYKNQATYKDKNGNEISSDRNNPQTMYFYDVFQWLENADGTAKQVTLDGDYYVLDSVEDVLIWDILHYAKEGNVWNTFNNTYLSTPYSSYYGIYWEHIIFAGELDLSKISFYPVTRVGGRFNGDNAVIKFDSSIMEGWTLSNLEECQHQGINAGLFFNPQMLYINNSYDTYNEEDGSTDYAGEITLTGNVGSYGSSGQYSGALILGDVGIQYTDTYADGETYSQYGAIIYNITLDNLKVNNYDTANRDALLVSRITGHTQEDVEEVEAEGEHLAPVSVIFDGIKMINYSADTKVAAALLGTVGGADIMDIKLDFRNMKIADGKDAGTHNGNALQYASFIYEYNYTNDSSINTGYGLYLFCEADADADEVTYGNELDNETEFCNNNKSVFETTGKGPETLYIPYVYLLEEKNIEVNPKSGDILKGCGTYDDPYIIENVKQFLTLYRYMNDTIDGSTDETFYNGWKVIKTGDDSSVCTNKHDVEEHEDGTFTGDGAEDAKIFGEDDDFPTPEVMSRAYYRLGADIDLSQDMSTTYQNIATNFVGFGTEERPFVGVWYGKGDNETPTDTTDDVIHTITLPQKTSTDPRATYGFIQYAKGAVVKDLILKADATATVENADGTTTTKDITAKISSSGGAVIATVLGGDNIIDNVVVDVNFDITSANAAIGGYVGTVKKGGLILRNVSDGSDGTKAALVDFAVDVYNAAGASSMITLADCELLGAVVGKVEDGYVLYEGSGDTVSALWSGKGGNNTITNQIANYNIINADALKANSVGLTVGQTSSTDANNITTNSITFTIPTASALQVMAMALNSDALNVRPSTYTNYADCGYTEISRSRKAQYSDIGNATASTTDYINAAKYDNVANYPQGENAADPNMAFAYPYLYNYMGITGDAYEDYCVTLADNGVAAGEAQQIVAGAYSTLNIRLTYSISNSTETEHFLNILQWNLTPNGGNAGVYDMAVFEDSFRGFGGLYGNVEFGGAFHANFDGMNNTININMNRILLGEDKTNASIAKAGLFNVLYARAEGLYQTTVDFADINGVAAEKKCAVIKNFSVTGNIIVNKNKGSKNFSLGAVAAEINAGDSRYVFDNITVRDFYAAGYANGNRVNYTIKKNDIGNAGGIVAAIGSNASVLMQNCNINNAVLYAQSNLGGLVGSANSTVLKIVSCKVNHLCNEICIYSNLYQVEVVGKQGATNSAGFIGEATSAVKNVIIIGTEENKCSVVNSDILGHQRAGGLIGAAKSNTSVSYVEVENTKLMAYKNIGGMIAYAEGSDISSIMNVKVKDIVIYEINLTDATTNGLGGIVGRNEHTMEMQNARVEGTITDSKYNCMIHTSNNKARSNDDNGVGGIVGIQRNNPLILIDCAVDSVSLKTDQGTTNSRTLGVGGLVGYTNASVMLLGAVSTSNLYVEAPKRSEAAGSIMAAGGCFGVVGSEGTVSGFIYVNDSGTTVYEYYNGLTATQNTVTGKQAGGLIGHVGSNNTNVRLTGISVSQGIVTSDELAGGVFGSVNTSWNGVAFENTAANRVTNMNISGRQAGGVIGDLVIMGPIRMESLELTGNTIVGIQEIADENYSVGGVIGGVCANSNKQENDTLKLHNATLSNNTIVAEVADTTLQKEAEYLAVGGMIGRMYAYEAESDSAILADNFNLVADAEEETGNVIGVRVSSADDSNPIQLVYGAVSDSTATYTLATPSAPALGDGSKDSDALVQLMQDYGYYAGNMVGVVQSDNIQMYVLRSDDGDGSNKFVIPVLKDSVDGNVVLSGPVTDVGRVFGQDINDYRQYCHIIYGAEVNYAKTIVPDADGKTNLTEMKAEVDKVASAFSGDEDLTALLQEYRLSDNAISMFYDTYKASYSASGSDELQIDFPILVYKAEYGTLQQMMDYITDIMTNVAGISSSDMEYLTVESAAKLYNSQTNAFESGTVDVIEISRDDSGQTYYSTSELYDGIVSVGSTNYLSYTEITYTYGWGSHVKVFKIPVFVEEPILYNVHMNLIEGRVADVAEIKTNGINDTTDKKIVITNDSDYTMLLEYSYSKARKNMPETTVVDKVLSLTWTTGNTIPTGTRLMLIDVSNGNKAYYYTVQDGQNLNEIYFTQFTDSTGLNNYVNKPIRDISDVTEDGYSDLAGDYTFPTTTGVEQFLVLVLSPETPSNSESYYTISTYLDVPDTLQSRFYTTEGHSSKADLSISAIPGLQISLQDTAITGQISKESTLSVKTSIDLTAASSYWRETTGENAENAIVINSANSGMYLDLAFYLRDEDNSTRVQFPVGTNVSYTYIPEGQTEKITSEGKAIPNESVFYYYKDIRDKFSLDNFEYLLSDLTSNETVSVEFSFDFNGADMTNITEDHYNAWIELLRTADKNYPMGNGNKLDDDYALISADAVQPLGFAVRATDLTQLAINTYPVATSNSIDYEVLFDFTSLLEQFSGGGLETVADMWANYNYTVTFRILQKQISEGEATYVPYEGNTISINAVDYEIDEDSKTPVGVSKLGTAGTLTVTYIFTSDQILNDKLISLSDNKHFITINSADLTTDLTKLTNYKLEATLVISEREASDDNETSETVAKETKDFFIYTITKLKNDL